MSKPSSGSSNSRRAHGGMQASKQQSAMKRPQRGLGVAELERIRLQEEQQEHLLYLHNVELQHAHFMSAYCNSGACNTMPIPLHLHNIPTAAPPPPQSPSPPTFIPNPNYAFIATAAIDTAAPPPLPPPPTFISNPNHAFIAAAGGGAASTALPSSPCASFIPSCNAYIVPIVGTSLFDPNIIPHVQAPNTRASYNYVQEGSLLDLHPNQQEHSFFPVYPSSCLHGTTLQAAKNNIDITYNGGRGATVDNEETTNSWIKQSVYNTFSEALSPALQKSMELELPSFQKQQDMENQSKISTCEKCCLDLNLTQEDYEISSYDATKPPWKIISTSKHNESFTMGSLPRNNFLKLGPPTTIERADEQIHLNVRTNIPKSVEGSKSIEENLSHNNKVKVNVVAKIDLNLKLSLPGIAKW